MTEPGPVRPPAEPDDGPIDARLVEVLARGQDLGFLGRGPVSDHVRNARVFAGALLAHAQGGQGVDLGSGAGTPGLVLAIDPRLADWRWTLIDAMAKRTAFLSEAIGRLGLGGRVTVRGGRAEELARDPELRQRADAVVARSFGSPAVVAECAAGLLAPGGVLLVSEPPGADEAVDPGRWPAEGLAALGLAAERVVRRSGAGVAVLRQTRRCGDRYPRRIGVPAKRPIF